MQNHEIMTIKSLAEHLKISPRSICKLVKRYYTYHSKWRIGGGLNV